MDYNDDKLKDGLNRGLKTDAKITKYAFVKSCQVEFTRLVDVSDFRCPDDIPDDPEEIPATIEIKEDTDWDANSGKSFQETMKNRKIKVIPNLKSFLPNDDFEVRKYIKSGNSVLSTAYGVERVPLIKAAQMDKIRDCNGYLVLGCESSDKKILLRSNNCGYKLCPICQRKRASLRAAQLAMMSMYCRYGDKLLELANRRVEAITKQESGVYRLLCDSELQEIVKSLDETPKYTFLFLTLTVKNREHDASLREYVKTLKIYIKQLFRRKFFIDLGIQGFVTKFEVTRNADTGEFHPHFHIIIAIDRNYRLERYGINRKLLWQNIQAAWLDMTGDSYIVQVKVVRDFLDVAYEIAKYECKPDGITDFSKHSNVFDDDKRKVMAQYLAQTFRLRTITFGGIYREAKQKLTNGELGCLATRELVKLLYLETWTWRKSEYKLCSKDGLTNGIKNKMYRSFMESIAKFDGGEDDFFTISDDLLPF